MTLQIVFQDGVDAGKRVQFTDQQTKIVLGRDPQHCDVVFPATLTVVGRQHVALRQELGHYRLVLNRNNVVMVDGKVAYDDEELPLTCVLQLGMNGPQLTVETQLPSDLPATSLGPRPESLVSQMQRQTRRVRGMIAALTALLVVLVAVSWRMTNHVQQLGAAQAQDRSRFEAKYSTLIQGQDGNAAREQMLSRASHSVLLVVRQDLDGKVVPVATAWVVDATRGIVATNAHVAETWEGIGESGDRLLVRSSGGSARDYEVVRVELHPGYRSFQEVWQVLKPSDHGTDVGSPGGFDVGLMYVKTDTPLPPALPLASPESLWNLKPGDAIGYSGFPTEGMALGGVHVAAPTPTNHFAYIVAMTDYFGDGACPPQQRYLVQHALPIAGGASGSPILNQQGEVVGVVSSMTSIGKSHGVRIGSSAMVNFGQRADLIAELLDGTASQRNDERQRDWKSLLSKWFNTSDELKWAQIKDRIELVVQQWTSSVKHSVDWRTTATSSVDEEIPLQPDEMVSREIQIGQESLLLVWSQTGARFSLILQQENGESREFHDELFVRQEYGNQAGRGQWQFRSHEAGRIRVALYQLQMTLAGESERIAAAFQKLAENQPVPIQHRQLVAEVPFSTSATGRVELDVVTQGWPVDTPLAVVALSDDGTDIDLRVPLASSAAPLGHDRANTNDRWRYEDTLGDGAPICYLPSIQTLWRGVAQPLAIHIQSARPTCAGRISVFKLPGAKSD